MNLAYQTRQSRSVLPAAEQVTVLLVGISLAVTAFALGRLVAADSRTLGAEAVNLGETPLRDALRSEESVRRAVQAP